jgi:hypothetical protein
LQRSVGPLVISTRVRVGSADSLTIVDLLIGSISHRARRLDLRDRRRALGRDDVASGGQFLGSVSRHARAHRALAEPVPVFAVAVPVVEPTFFARLMLGVASPPARPTAGIAMSPRAVDFAAIAIDADHEKLLAPRAARLPPGSCRRDVHRDRRRFVAAVASLARSSTRRS